MNTALFRTSILGGAFFLSAAAVAWTSLSACESLSQTSPLPPEDASDLDAGALPEDPDEPPPGTSSGGTVDAGPAPASGRVRLANLLQGPSSVDLCAIQGMTVRSQLITANPSEPTQASKPDGLKLGETSQHVFLFADVKGTPYTFRVVPAGADCSDMTTQVYATITSATATLLKQNSGITLVVFGEIKEGVDAGDATPRGIALADTISPPATASLFRVFHGVPDIAAFDVVINGETILSGVKYGTSFGYPYTSTSGFASIPAGIPEGATLTLRSGTTVRSFTIPARLRRGIASTVFVGGTSDKLVVSLCSDRSPTKGTTATCDKLVAQ